MSQGRDHAAGPAPARRHGGPGGLKTFRCGDVVPGCGEVFTGTEGQILQDAGAHAVRDHGVDATDESLLALVRAAMRPV